MIRGVGRLSGDFGTLSVDAAFAGLVEFRAFLGVVIARVAASANGDPDRLSGDGV